MLAPVAAVDMAAAVAAEAAKTLAVAAEAARTMPLKACSTKPKKPSLFGLGFFGQLTVDS
ncbi:MAG: hypothetical protein IJS04_08070 [Muribaculaceae bacterium]|nr:hypothetical protein [Muribaculaceae bacterium]